MQIDTDLELFIPDDYVNIVKERLALYQELSQVKTPSELNDFEHTLLDRFGPLPEATNGLLDSMHLKWVATQLGIERLIIKRGSCICYFVSDQQSPFFQTESFSFLLMQIQKAPDRLKLKEKSTQNGPKLLLSIHSIDEIKKLTSILQSLVFIKETSAS